MHQYVMHAHKVTTCQGLLACHVQIIAQHAIQQPTAYLVWQGISFQVEVVHHVLQRILIVSIVQQQPVKVVNQDIF